MNRRDVPGYVKPIGRIVDADLRLDVVSTWQLFETYADSSTHEYRYYFDEEKKKYFKIQANHLVPQGAKYAKESVKKEKRSTKKRKIENERQARREKETIKQAPALKSAAIGGIGLEREHGLSLKTARRLMQCERATISQWMPERVEIKMRDSSPEIRVQDAHYIPECEQMVVASAHAQNGT